MANLWKKAIESGPAIEDGSSSRSELKSALKKVDYKPTSNKARFKDISRGLTKQGKNKHPPRPTIIQNARKKNLAYYDRDIYNVLKLRKQIVIRHNGRNATPHPLTESDLIDVEESYTEEDRRQRTESLWDTLVDHFVRTRIPSFNEPLIEARISEILPDMDDITAEVPDRTDSSEVLDVEATLRHIKEDRRSHPSAQNPKNFMKLTLTETDDIVLFENISLTVPKGTDEAEAVEKYNYEYEYLTKGPGKNRRTCEAEVQTENVLVKSRSANTERIKKQDQESFNKEIQLDDELHSKMEVTTYSREGENIDEVLNTNENFHLSSMILQRLLAGNVFRERQRRFRNMIDTNPLDLNIKYLYRLQTLWTYKCVDTMGKDVVDMSWCHTNGDLLAVGYGTYYYRESKNRTSGAVLLWSIKNPVNPERRYRYRTPVTAVEFSKQTPQLLAVALFDGTIEILDVSDESNAAVEHHIVVAKSERTSSPGYEPVWQIQWIQIKDKEFIITGSQDGRIMKYEIATGPYLVGYRQLRLARIEGVVEALHVEHKKTFIEADRHPQALCLQKHPLNTDMYFVGTDEGCIHICSINFPHQHLSVLQVHHSGVYSIHFSPFSPKIYLTCGSDWTIRIWIEDIFEPIIELCDGFSAIHTAYWSPIHSTIIASCTHDAVQIWDLRRKNLKPASTRTFENRQISIIKFTPCGRSLLVGDEEGNVHVCSLEDFPFPPHFQYDELQKSLFRSLTNKQELEKQVKQLGYLGYGTEQRGDMSCKS
ncbi:dynein axonemal intermediate chain 4-like [Chironomus tepperi]|uniref:dynein axonemal intermediate chain 4-like n=1 Tax=Chironomus tepperi TaxID=113505 RepID=UPI00391F9F46